MLTTKLQESLDKKWTNCWPVSDLRPLALLDLISYLFFIKKADDLSLLHQKVKTAGIDNFIFSKEIEEFTWSNLQNLSASEIHQLFIKENGLIELMNNYGKLNSLYSDYFKSPLLIEPTPRLISNAIEIINIIETNDKSAREEIVEFLFEKSGLSSKNNQSFLPDHILKLMVAIAAPAADDTIFDPAAGNGSLLISAFKYINSGNNSMLPSPSFQLSKIKISGTESDIIRLRIAAMNMILHGINDPHINVTSENTEKEKASLVISSLPSSQETTPENTTIIQAGRESSLLNDSFESLSNAGRAVVLVRQDLLQNEDPAIVKLRKKLADQFNLEGVITLESKSKTLFSGSTILIFDRSKSTENIWFYKWRSANKKMRNSSINDEYNNYDLAEAAHISDQWKIRKDSSNSSSANSFFIPVDNIRSNNYNLSFNDYKLTRLHETTIEETGKSIPDSSETVLAAKKENLHEFFEASEPLSIPKQKRKMAPVLVVLFILIGAAVAFYWVYPREIRNFFERKFSAQRSGITADSSIQTRNENSKVSSTSNDLVSFADHSKGENNSESDSIKYTVINKTWFHYEPDSAKIKPLYLTPRKELVLTSRDEENGFVYVVYINSKGGATHGWLDKKDLQPVD